MSIPMRWLGAISLWLLLILPRGLAAQASTSAVAESAVAEPAEYRGLVRQALDEYERQHFEESRALFLRAHALFPNARTERGLGFVAFELRDYVECAERLEAALTSQVRPLNGDLRSEAQQVLERARQFVGRVAIVSTPPATTLIVDGVVADRWFEGKKLTLGLGEHRIELSVDGYPREHRTVHVKSASEQTLNVVFLPQSGVALKPSDAAPAKSDGKAWYKSPWLWGTLGVVVVGAAAAGTTVALSREETAKPYRSSSGETLTGP